MFLRDPWYWPEIWQINPQVANPHLIFPGDILSLAYLNDGRPVVTLERGQPAGGGGVERLVAARSLATSRGGDLDDSVRDARIVLVAASLLTRRADQRCAVRVRASRRPHGQRRARRLCARHRCGGRLRLQRRARGRASSSIPTTTRCLATKASTSDKVASSAAAIPATVYLSRRSARRRRRLPVSRGNARSVEFPPALSRARGRRPDHLGNDGVSLIGQYQVVVINRGSSGARARARAAHISDRRRRDTIVAGLATKSACRTSWPER